MRRALERALPYLATLIVGGLLAVVGLNLFSLNSDVDSNSAAIERSCEVLNAAIVESQQSMGSAATRILIAAIFKATPEAAAPYQAALLFSPPALRTIDCARVADDPNYRPYK